MAKAPNMAEAANMLGEDRKLVIERTINRIMKARRTLKNQALIQEVISQISQQFTPKLQDIKKAIETMLEKEYIERAEGQPDTFKFIS